MVRPKGKTANRVHISARILETLANELYELTVDRNPNRSQVIENAIRDYMPTLRKLKKRERKK